MNLNLILIALYGVIVIVGGVIGYAKADSSASLIMGLLTGSALLIGNYGLYKGLPASWGVVFATTLILIGFFLYRFILTGKFMPAGLMILISICAMGILFKSNGNR